MENNANQKMSYARFIVLVVIIAIIAVVVTLCVSKIKQGGKVPRILI